MCFPFMTILSQKPGCIFLLTRSTARAGFGMRDCAQVFVNRAQILFCHVAIDGPMRSRRSTSNLLLSSALLWLVECRPHAHIYGSSRHSHLGVINLFFGWVFRIIQSNCD